MIPYKRVTLRSPLAPAAIAAILQQIASGHDPELTGRQLPTGAFDGFVPEARNAERRLRAKFHA